MGLAVRRHEYRAGGRRAVLVLDGVRELIVTRSITQRFVRKVAEVNGLSHRSMSALREADDAQAVGVRVGVVVERGKLPAVRTGRDDETIVAGNRRMID